jgi:hypothetical protein
MPDSEAVKMYRDRFKLNCSVGRKYDIDATVTDLDLWEYVLNSWGYYKNGKWRNFSPLNLSGLLSEYERLENAKPEQRRVVDESVTEHRETSVAQRRDTDLSDLFAPLRKDS